tara:strand:- start:448 stop:1083 length:636 start_codon:yes stop_codon:yes gene_type:complete
MDSGGFTEMHRFGKWTLSAKEYAKFAQRCSGEIGKLQWVAPQDYMCEKTALKASGLTVKEHQRLTVDNFLELRQLLGELVIPVLQGWEHDDYLICCDMYEKVGIDLTKEKVIGLGSVCRRNSTESINRIIESMQPLKLHGFGIKGSAFIENLDRLVSADSMAWSMQARFDRPLVGCTHKRCEACYEYANWWRSNLLKRIPDQRYRQQKLTI